MADRLTTVFGGSGFVGRNVVRELAKRGDRVRVAVRRPHLAHHLKPLGVVGQIQLMQANVRNRPSVEKALDGADACVYLPGVLASQGRQTFKAVQEEGARTVAEAAAAAGVELYVHMSAIGADATSKSEYARTKAAGERSVCAAMPEATIIRPSIVFGEGDGFFNRFAAMARFAPALPAIGGGKTRFQPVYVDDVADAICEALDRAEARGATYELGGPAVYTFNELMKLMMEVIGRKRLLAPIPFPIAGLMGLAGEISGALPFIDPFLTRDQVELLKSDNIVGASGDEGVLTTQDLGITPESVEAIIPTYLERYRKYGQFADRPAA
ncbi:MAG: complex I NDUFA9 subunit family protein [Pseudomonadota bacterium]